ncbi:MAG TPA: ion channel [Chitinophagaceae bacterium]|nr:ion channel [Chitinophagaceae bacterium]
MAGFQKINPRIHTNNDTGFGTNANSYGGRFVNRDGSFNLRREGISFIDRFSVYQKMLSVPRWKFFLFIFLFYLGINVLYTFTYLLIGLDGLQGLTGVTTWARIKEVFYFSTQTFTTVGYGRVNPITDGASLLASVEALNGLLSFAIVTGLIYGRFAKPKSFLLFSNLALIAPFKEATGLMFRLVPYKDKHVLTNVEVRVNLALQLLENDVMVNKFYNLSLERHRLDSLPMNWTVVHPITEESPLFGFTEADLKASDVEITILISGFDDVYSNIVLQQTSYTYEEIKMNAKYAPMYRESADGKTTILEMHKLHDIVPLS